MGTKKLNTLFQQTEPIEAAAAADPEPIAAGSPETMESKAEPTKARKPQRIKPQSVYLNESELLYIQDIANTYGETRHAVMQYAIKELIRQWRAGKKPRINNMGKLDR